MDVLAGREIHHRVGAPENRPAQLLDFFLDRRAHGRVPDVGVDLHQEIAADDHRLELGVIDVGRDDRAAARHFRAHELGVEPFARGDELHLRRDDALARVVELRDIVLAAQHRAEQRLRQLGAPLRIGNVGARHRLDVAAAGNPVAPQRRQPFAHVVSLRAAGVVHLQRRLAARQRNLAHRHLVRPDINLARIGMRFLDGHLELLGYSRTGTTAGSAELGGTALPSPVSTGSGSKGLVSITLFISGIPLAVLLTITGLRGLQASGLWDLGCWAG